MTIKEKIDKAWELVNSKHIETNDEIQLVRFAVRTARELVERDTPMIPIFESIELICPKCREEQHTNTAKFCSECGQRLDWSEE